MISNLFLILTLHYLHFRSTGFILEGFPRNTEEARFLADSGFYPDCVINMATEEDDVVSRLMPPLLKKWKEKRDKKLAKKQKQLDIKMKKRVRISNEFQLASMFSRVVLIA